MVSSNQGIEVGHTYIRRCYRRRVQGREVHAWQPRLRRSWRPSHSYRSAWRTRIWLWT